MEADCAVWLLQAPVITESSLSYLEIPVEVNRELAEALGDNAVPHLLCNQHSLC